MMDWQPIETVPKDTGEAFLLCEYDPGEGWCTLYPFADVVVGWWDHGEWRDHGDIGCNGLAEFEPTHWMPLPPQPAIAIEAASAGETENTGSTRSAKARA
jgi:hypothetical protein